MLSPVAGLAQAAGVVRISPTAFGPADCASTTTSVSLSWTSSGTFATGDTYSIYASTTESCPVTGTPAGGLIASGVLATSASQTYPTTETLTRKDFITKAGITTCGAATIHVCVQHWPSAGTGGTAKGTAKGTADLVVSPASVPVNVSVAPGDTALFVSWADGTDSAILAVSYNVTAVGSTGTRTQNFTSVTGLHRVNSLTNGDTYSVTVTSVSAGGNESLASAAVTGTPAPVVDFWDRYTDAAHREQGGCGGGPAGALSLLGVALALRGLRRRS